MPVGGDASYELHVHNRGTKVAENVEVMAYFSNGVEPIKPTDAPIASAPGQVIFDLIPAIAPADEIILKVKARRKWPAITSSAPKCIASRWEFAWSGKRKRSSIRTRPVSNRRWPRQSRLPIVTSRGRPNAEAPLPLPQNSGDMLPAAPPATIKR